MSVLIPVGIEHAIVDDADKELVSAYRWYRNRRYASCTADRKTVYMHRLILGDVCHGLHVDHVNRNGLDNRRANLRVATPGENAANTRNRRAHGYRGVYQYKNRWRAEVYFSGKRVFRKAYATPEEAAIVRDKIVLELFGKFAALNFPEIAAEAE